MTETQKIEDRDGNVDLFEEEPPLPSRRRLVLEALGVYAAFQVFTIVVLKALRTSGQTFFQDVLINGIGPDRQAAADYLRDGFLPTWTRDLYGGVPFIANIQHAVYYVGNIPWLFLPTSTALEVVVATTVAFAAFAMWAYCRFALRTSTSAAILGGLAFGFGGVSLQHIILTNQLQAISWMPLVLLFGHLALERGRLRWVVLTAVSIGMQFLAGHPEEWVYTVGALALYGTVWTFARGLGREWLRRAGQSILRLGGAVVLFVLLFGWQLFPTLTLRSQGYRQAANFREQYPLPKAIAANSLLPDFGRVVYGENPSHIGLVALALAVLGLAAVGARSLRWVRVYLLVLAAFGFLMALGHATPIYGFAYDNVSIVRGFRVPSRYLMLPTFGLSAAAALGLDALLRRTTWRPRLVDAGRALALLLLGAAFVLIVGDFKRPDGSLTEWGVAALVGGLVWVAAAFPAVPRVALAAVLIVTTGVELHLARPMAEYRQVAPNATYDEYGPIIERIAREGGRFVTNAKMPNEGAVGDPIPIPEGIDPGREADYFRAGFSYRVISRPNVHVGLHSETVIGRDGGLMPFRLYKEFFESSMNVSGAVHRGIHVTPPSQWSWETLDYLAVRWFVTNPLPPEEQAALASHGFTRVERFAFAELWGRDPLPLIRVATNVLTVRDEADRLALLKDFPLRTNAIVEEPLDGVSFGATGTVRNERIGMTTVSATVDAAAPALVVLSDPWYPQWRAYVDGKKVPLVRTNHAFRGVVVPAGTHEVEFRYEDAAHKKGLVLALLTILGLVAVPFALKMNRRRRTVER